MKLLIVTSLKEYQQVVAEIFHKAQIKVFSVSETTGFKDDHETDLMDSWFGTSEESFDSVFIFSFTTTENAEKALQMIKDYNSSTQTAYPIRAFLLPVEQSSY